MTEHTPLSDDGAPHRTPTWLAWVGRLEMAVGCVALALIFVSVLIQAVQRYSPFQGLPWTGELARFSLVWVTFSVVGLLITRHDHITVQLVDTIRNDKLLTGVQVFALLVVAAVGVGGFAESFNLVRTQARLSSPAMGMPMSWLFLVPAFGFASLVVRSLAEAWLVLRHGPHRQVLSEVTGSEAEVTP